MNIETRKNKKHREKHIRFQTLLIATGMVLALIFEMIYIGISFRNVRQNAQTAFEEEMRAEHSRFCDSFLECARQVERIETFIRGNNLMRYVAANLNLVTQESVEEYDLWAEESMQRLSVSNRVADSFLLVGSNRNNKNLYCEIGDRKLTPGSFPPRDVLEKSGLLRVLLANWGNIGRMNEGELQSQIRKNADFDDAERESLQNLIAYLEGHFFACTYIEDTLVLIRLNDAYFEEKFDMGEGYSFFVFRSTEDLLFRVQGGGRRLESLTAGMDSRKEAFEDEECSYTCTYNLYGNLNVVTAKEKDMSDSFFRNGTKGRILLLTAILLAAALLSFAILYVISKQVFIRLDKIYQEIRKQAQSHNFSLIETEEKKSIVQITISNRIFLALICSCLVSLIVTGVLFRRITDYDTRNSAYDLVKSIGIRYENQFETYYDRYNSLSTAMAETFIRDFQGEDYQSNYELIKEFEGNFYYETSFLPGYSYAFIVKGNTNVLYQTAFSSQTGISGALVNQALTTAEQRSENGVFVPVDDVFSGERKVAFVKKLYLEDAAIGNMIIVLDAPALQKNYMADMLRANYYVVDQKKHELMLTDGDTDYYEWLKETSSGLYAVDDLIISADDHLKDYLGICVVAADYGFYRKQIRQYQFYSFLLMLGIGVICLAVSFALKSILIRPFNILLNHMNLVPEGIYKKVPESHMADEIDTIADAYNRMIVRLEKMVDMSIRQATRQQELELLRVQAEFKMLQQQINPHFLFNTLEIINLLAINNHEDDISRMVKCLSHIMRYAISKSTIVNVKREIEALEAYIEIQRFRFDANFDIELDLDRTLFDCYIIKFILQPLVENAITHGMKQTAGGGRILVTLSCYEEGLEFKVSDNGIGMSEAALEQLRESIYDPGTEYSQSSKSGIGLKNVYRRIKLYYNDRGEFQIDSKEGEGMTVTLRIPFELDNGEM